MQFGGTLSSEAVKRSKRVTILSSVKMDAAPLVKRIKIEVNNCGSSAYTTNNVPSNSLKIERMSSLGLEETVHLPKSKTKLNGSSTKVKESAPGNSAKVDTDALIKKFVSTLDYLITAKENKKIIDKVHYLIKKCPEKYLRSKDFEYRINSALENIQRDPNNMYVYIKEVCDELKMYRNRNTANKCGTKSAQVEPESLDTNEKKIRSLEKQLKKLHRVITKLKREEVSLDEMDDNCTAYIYEDKFMKRFMKVWNKLSELKKHSPRLENNVDKKFHYTGSRYPELNSEVGNFINMSKMFPDYSDILKVTRTVNESSLLGLSEGALQILAQEVFQDVGHELKRRRVSDYQDLFGSYLTDDVEVKNDPAESDLSLKESLEQNYKEGQSKLQKMLSEFTEKQTTLKLEPKEVGDIDVTKDNIDFSDSDNEDDKAIEQEQIEDEMYSEEEILHNGSKSNSIDEKSNSEDENSKSDVEKNSEDGSNGEDEKCNSADEPSES